MSVLLQLVFFGGDGVECLGGKVQSVERQANRWGFFLLKKAESFYTNKKRGNHQHCVGDQYTKVMSLGGGGECTVILECFSREKYM